MFEYKKPWYSFGIIKRIYYSNNFLWLVDFDDGSTKRLRECNLEDFKYNSDRTAYIKAKETMKTKREECVDYVVFADQ